MTKVGHTKHGSHICETSEHNRKHMWQWQTHVIEEAIREVERSQWKLKRHKQKLKSFQGH
jgi:hypothetical protein